MTQDSVSPSGHPPLFVVSPQRQSSNRHLSPDLNHPPGRNVEEKGQPCLRARASVFGTFGVSM